MHTTAAVCPNCMHPTDSTGACTNHPRCARAAAQQRTRISPADLLFVAGRMSPSPIGRIPEKVIESAFLLSCLIDVEITRLASSPEDRDRMLALVVDHIEDRRKGVIG